MQGTIFYLQTHFTGGRKVTVKVQELSQYVQVVSMTNCS